MNTTNKHTFHIPVMGTGFSIDTPVKVAKYGISSVISIVDDILVENMREYYSNKLGIPFNSISEKNEDFRAKRFTEYLNLVNKIVKEEFEEIKNSYHKNIDEIHKYFDLLPNANSIKDEFNNMIHNNEHIQKVIFWLNNNLFLGSIDVNIMTKVDNPNYIKNIKLPVEYNDAHASLRGFANSDLESSLVLSAGMNSRLYSYISNFDDFYPDENGKIKKKLIIKVSDYRSAIIQGKFLAKKGLWVSEFRIESGLNCGGHAFASDGFLLGPILEEFKNKKSELVNTLHEIFVDSLKTKNKAFPNSPLNLFITAQGGVGTAHEHNFLLDYYKLDTVGWATPFLLVPEVTNVNQETLQILLKAKEEDLYLSNISPLGVPFNTVRGSSQEIEKLGKFEKGNPGSPCPKKFLLFNTEFSEKEICTASREYQHLKLKELVSKNLSGNDYKTEEQKIIQKECLCVGLSNSTQHIHGVDNKIKSKNVSICPGPNLAYFDEILTLKQMVDHIYGKINVIKTKTRPNLFIKELTLYYNYLKNKIEEIETPFTDKQIEYFDKFSANLNDGINYYKELFANVQHNLETKSDEVITELENIKDELSVLMSRINLVNQI